MKASNHLTIFADCGFTHNTDEKVREGLKSLKDPSLAEEIDKLRFGTFGSPER